MSPDERQAMLLSAAARFDKHGNQLPESSHGCGCQLCADAHLSRTTKARRPWTRLVHLIQRLFRDSGHRPQAA